MTQAECRLLVQSLAERQLLEEFQAKREKTLDRQRAKYVPLRVDQTLTQTVARRVGGVWIDAQGVPVVDFEKGPRLMPR